MLRSSSPSSRVPFNRLRNYGTCSSSPRAVQLWISLGAGGRAANANVFFIGDHQTAPEVFERMLLQEASQDFQDGVSPLRPGTQDQNPRVGAGRETTHIREPQIQGDEETPFLTDASPYDIIGGSGKPLFMNAICRISKLPQHRERGKAQVFIQF